MDSPTRCDDLDASALGARAYAVIDGFVCQEPIAFCFINRGKRVAYVAHVGEGRFCVGVDGINAAASSSLALVTPFDANVETWAAWRLANQACVGAEFEVQTGKGANALDQNFTIVIP